MVPAPFDRAYKAPAFRKRYRSTKLTLTTAHVRGSARINDVGLRVIARCTVRECSGDSELNVYLHKMASPRTLQVIGSRVQFSLDIDERVY